MKLYRHIWLLLGICCVAFKGYAQGASPYIISSRIIPLKYHDRTDTIRLPVVSTQYPALKKALSYESIADGDNLPSVIKNYDTCGCGPTGLDYEVIFKSKNIISIKFYFDSMGAYPNTYQKWLSLNVHTGKLYPIVNEINAAGLRWIYKSYRDTLRRRIREDKQANTDEDTDTYEALKTGIESLESNELLGKYVFTEKGIVFSIDRILPHVVQSFEPDEELLIPYEKLRKYRTVKALVIK